MDGENTATRLAVMETQIGTLLQSTKRIETTLDKLFVVDKSIESMAQKQEYLVTRLIELEKEVDKCASSHNAETKKLWDEVSGLKDNYHSARGMAIGAMIFIGVITSIATFFFTFLFNTANENKTAITEQRQVMKQIDRELGKMK